MRLNQAIQTLAEQEDWNHESSKDDAEPLALLVLREEVQRRTKQLFDISRNIHPLPQDALEFLAKRVERKIEISNRR